MSIIEEAIEIYYKEMAKREKMIAMLNSEDIQKLEKMGLITIHNQNIPKEEDILHDSFHSAACRISYLHETLFVYVGDFQNYRRRRGFRSYIHTNTRDWDKDLPLDYECVAKKYVGLLTERGKIIYPYEWEDFKRYHTIIHLPYSYKITEVGGLYLVGKWPLVKEAFETEGFCEQFRSIQNFYFRKLLEGQWKEAEEQLKNEKTLQKICIRK